VDEEEAKNGSVQVQILRTKKDKKKMERVGV
jgi:hypothetical protein